jgi:hypothetical protein
MNISVYCPPSRNNFRITTQYSARDFSAIKLDLTLISYSLAEKFNKAIFALQQQKVYYFNLLDHPKRFYILWKFARDKFNYVHTHNKYAINRMPHAHIN